MEEETYAEKRLRETQEEAKAKEIVEFEKRVERAALVALEPPRIGTGLAGPGSKKGRQKFGGRKAGARNKFTLAAKDQFIRAFEDAGGTRALTEWAKLNRNEFYKLYGRLIPIENQVAGPKGKPIPVKMELEFVKPESTVS